jgi:hypothetical protein
MQRTAPATPPRGKRSENADAAVAATGTARHASRDATSVAYVPTTRVAVLAVSRAIGCSAGCSPPWITDGPRSDAHNNGYAVFVNVVVDPDGNEVAPGVVVEGARWALMRTYHLDCYDRLRRPYGDPSRDARDERCGPEIPVWPA